MSDSQQSAQPDRDHWVFWAAVIAYIIACYFG